MNRDGQREQQISAEEEECSQTESSTEVSAEEKARWKSIGWIDRADDEWYSDNPSQAVREAWRANGWR